MRNRSLTLVELLVVVAIIGLLASIAIPNFLLAQIRARVARVKADLRVLGNTLEQYRVDYPGYPESIFAQVDENKVRLGIFASLPTLTTPVSYLTALPQDPFLGGNYQYFSVKIDPGGQSPFQQHYGDWVLFSIGPDRDINFNPFAGGLVEYDPTNGTVSKGDIIRSQRQGQHD